MCVAARSSPDAADRDAFDVTAGAHTHAANGDTSEPAAGADAHGSERNAAEFMPGARAEEAGGDAMNRTSLGKRQAQRNSAH